MKTFAFATSFLLCLFVFTPGVAAENDKAQEKLAQDIQQCINLDKMDSREGDVLTASIMNQVETLGSDATPLILQKIKDPNTSEHALTIYVWAAGFTKDPSLIDTLIDIHKNKPAKIVNQNALRSMAYIGTDKTGEYLLAVAKKMPPKQNESSEEPGKYDILDLLAMMQYEKALPEMEYVLKQDHKEYYWQSIFCYGKMGEKSIPYLIKKIDSSDVNIRFNAINLLGQILIAPEASEPLRKQYWKEKDHEIKMLILSSLEKITPDLSIMKRFSEEVAAKEQDAELKKYAQETVAGIDRYKKTASDFKQKSKPDKALFDAEYKRLFKSAGKDGSIDTLGTYSTAGDDVLLKQLRRRFLDRNSDECFYDYEEINRIIMTHRLIAQNKDVQ